VKQKQQTNKKTLIDFFGKKHKKNQLSVKMDALRRMQEFSAIEKGQTLLQVLNSALIEP
jgi:hypothetical protein